MLPLSKIPEGKPWRLAGQNRIDDGSGTGAGHAAAATKKDANSAKSDALAPKSDVAAKKLHVSEVPGTDSLVQGNI